MNTRVLFAIVCAMGLTGCDKKDSTSPYTAPVNTAPKTVPMDSRSTAMPSTPGAMAGESPTTAPNNSGINTRDRAADALTAGMAGQTKPDVVLAADIRKRIVATEMSVDAKNVKVVVLGGKVTLRGPVKSQEEKDTIAKIAVDVGGEANVDNQLEITAAPANNP